MVLPVCAIEHGVQNTVKQTSSHADPGIFLSFRVEFLKKLAIDSTKILDANMNM
tara:strand:+ start:4849 stop:5010 length:162 start_codon:yes stop_codon:yes gene_type:complete